MTTPNIGLINGADVNHAIFLYSILSSDGLLYFNCWLWVILVVDPFYSHGHTLRQVLWTKSFEHLVWSVIILLIKILHHLVRVVVSSSGVTFLAVILISLLLRLPSERPSVEVTDCWGIWSIVAVNSRSSWVLIWMVMTLRLKGIVVLLGEVRTYETKVASSLILWLLLRFIAWGKWTLISGWWIVSSRVIRTPEKVMSIN